MSPVMRGSGAVRPSFAGADGAGGEDDILILTADHGCDPTWQGTDHTREHIPVLIYGPKVKPGSLGHRETFADIGQTIASYFGTSPMDYGKNML
jgi:phosphopentomutase